MARKPSTPSQQARTELLVSRQTAKGQIEERIDKGRALLSQVQGPNALQVMSESEKWTSYNRELLRSLFSTRELEHSYAWCSPVTAITEFGGPMEQQRLRNAHERLTKELQNLESVVERLGLYPEPATGASAMRAQDAASATATPSRAFVVHGRDTGTLQTVARFLEQLGVDPVILHEQASRGDTLIEKLERHSDVPFAVVLLTADDEGRLAGSEGMPRPRARQNVVLELGYFVGRLGRERVCALHAGDIELPSDWDGVVWVQLDVRGGWKFELARELRAAGFSVNMNLVV
jgi:predicted nucleotide-binding protein